MSLAVDPKRLAASVVQRSELMVIGLMVAASLFLPGTAHFSPLPAGIYGEGVVSGAALALQAIGLVLVFRTSRVINFAQVALGSIAAVIFLLVVHVQPLLLGANSLCSCLTVRQAREINSQHTFHVVVNVPYWLYVTNLVVGLVLALVVAAGAAWVIHRLVVKPLEDKSPLVLTVVTIALSQTIDGFVGLVSGRFTGHGNFGGTIRLPLPLHLTLAPAHFNANDIVTVIALGLAFVGVIAFLHRTSLGVLMRGLADNAARARSLGVDTARVRSLAWVIAGTLSGIAAVLGSSTQQGSGSLADTGQLVRLLAVLVLARMERVGLAVAAALSLSVLKQTMKFSLADDAIVDVVVLGVVTLVLLLQHSRNDRVDTETVSATDFGTEVRPTPPGLRSVHAVRSSRFTLIVVTGLVVAGLPFVLSTSQQTLVTATVIEALLALSLLLLTGWAGQISLGQFGFAAVGGYVVAQLHLPFPLPLLLAGLAGSVAAVVVGLPALRLRGLSLAVTTLAFSQAVASYLLGTDQLGTHLPSRIERPFVFGIDLNADKVFYYLCLVVLGLAVLGIAGMRRGRTGRALIAARDNEAFAQTLGISLTRARLSAFALSGFLASVGGGLLAYDFGDVKGSTFGVTASIAIFLTAVVGGLGGYVPVLVGVTFFGVLQLLSSNPIVALLGTGLLSLLVLLVLPGGLGAGAYRLRDAFLRRIADRNRLVVPGLTRQSTLAGRALIAPPRTPEGTTYIPPRYRLDRQWSTGLRRSIDA